MPIKTFLDLDVYKLSRQLAQEIFQLTLKFPPEEKYSLTDQIRRSSRSVKANIAEGWGKRVYINSFKRHLVDSNGSLEETKSWCISALDCNYISTEVYENLINKAEVIGGKLWKLHDTWKDFEPKT
jgi:four helix bundle protein